MHKKQLEHTGNPVFWQRKWRKKRCVSLWHGHKRVNISPQTFTFSNRTFLPLSSIWPPPLLLPNITVSGGSHFKPLIIRDPVLICAVWCSASVAQRAQRWLHLLCACRPTVVSPSRRAIYSSTLPSSLNSSSSAQSCKLEMYPTLQALRGNIRGMQWGWYVINSFLLCFF